MKLKSKKERVKDLNDAQVQKRADAAVAKLTRVSAGQHRVQAAGVYIEEARQALCKAMQALSSVESAPDKIRPNVKTVYTMLKRAEESARDAQYDCEELEDWDGVKLDREPTAREERPWIEVAAEVM